MAGRLYAGTGGFSYAGWRGSFYPADARQGDLLRHYARRLPAVELSGVFYNVPSGDTFRRWAESTPPDFRFGVKMNRRIALGGDVAAVPTFVERVLLLGERLGPVRVQLHPSRPRDDGFLLLLLDSLAPRIQVAFEAEHESWNAPEVDERLAAAGAVRVNRLEGSPPFRYLRLRDPPYGEDDLALLAGQLRPLLAAGVDVYCFFKHEEDPRGALAAERLLELVHSS
jgi:uncharacterized protein YecE (DUF72 family)